MSRNTRAPGTAVTTPTRQARRDDRPVLITGGAGFVATNLADRLLRDGRSVIVFDDLSRAGVERNLRWLCDVHGRRVEVRLGDVRDADALHDVVRRVGHVYHFAAQVAVTTSLIDPVRDFEINARGTLNLLEAIRLAPAPPSLLFTSTNKVYGDLEDLALLRRETRYEPGEPEVCRNGISESAPLEFHSPYGCSKGVAEQYVLDYARTFHLRTVVFRMSCIYGPHQCGTEDQGWVAHFLLSALNRRPLTIYGDGLQVRDVLYVEDLVDAMLLAETHVDSVSGQAFNIGGGAANSTSLVELLHLIGELVGERPPIRAEPWRRADQRYYVSDTRKFRHQTGWAPRTSIRAGLGALLEWFADNARVPRPLGAGRVAS
jgi:CDP-paratose 2-epimerase